MWMFTEIGFFSAVHVKEKVHAELELPDEPYVMVRARVKVDLENLIALADHLYEKQDPRTEAALVDWKPEILQWRGRDYPYRVIMPRRTWAVLVEGMATEIDYPNFKDHVKKQPTQGSARASLYSKIWSVMFGAEREIDRYNRPDRYQGRYQRAMFADDDEAWDGYFPMSLGRSEPAPEPVGDLDPDEYDDPLEDPFYAPHGRPARDLIDRAMEVARNPRRGNAKKRRRGKKKKGKG